MQKQTEGILNLREEAFNEKLPQPFFGNETRGDMAAMGVFHESFHVGQIHMLKRFVTK